jgi:hypothetical protein
VRGWLALALACCLLPAWAQTPPPAQKESKKPAPVKPQKAQKAQKPQKAHAKATPEQIRKFNELQKKQDAKR